jgi:DNA-binding transcriptional LysR family regulator
MLADFAKSHPQIGLDVSFTDRLVNLVDEGFDLAVRAGRPGDSSLVARKLAEAQSVTVAAPEYLAARGTPQTPPDLAKHDCIIDTNRRDPHRWPYAEGSVLVSGRLIFSNASVCLTAAEAGLGIACLPDFVAVESLRAGRVVRVLREHEGGPMGIYAMTPSGRHLAAKVRLLIDALAQGMRQQ